MKNRRSDLDRLVEFQRFDAEADTGYAVQFREPGGVRYRRGNEVELAARMQARQPVIIIVNRNTRTEMISYGWRADIDGVLYRILEKPTFTKDRRFLEMLAESGSNANS